MSFPNAASDLCLSFAPTTLEVPETRKRAHCDAAPLSLQPGCGSCVSFALPKSDRRLRPRGSRSSLRAIRASPCLPWRVISLPT